MQDTGLEELDEDVEPRTDEESLVANNEDESEIESIPQDNREEDEEAEDEESDCELEDLGLSPEDIEAALSRFRDDEDSDATTSVSSSRRTSLTSSPPPDSDDEDVANNLLAPEVPLANTASSSTITRAIPTPPPQPTFSLIPPQATVRPALINYANLDSLDDTSSDDDSGDDEDRDGASENATAVTRFLIKRLPKQLSKLRNDKSELEDKIQDLEATISNQNQAMLEMERRVEVYKKEAETARKWTASLSLNIGKVRHFILRKVEHQTKLFVFI